MNSAEINRIANAVSLVDELKTPTEIRGNQSQSNPMEQVGLNAFDFEQEPDPVRTPGVQSPIEPDPEPIQFHQPQHPAFEVEEDYDAEKNARSLVNTMLAADTVVLNVVAYAKATKQAGGSAAIKEMKAALTKEISGAELTEQEIIQISKFKEYKANMELLMGKISISEMDRENLYRVAVDYCEESKIKVGPGLAFYATYVGSLAQRTTAILIS